MEDWVDPQALRYGRVARTEGYVYRSGLATVINTTVEFNIQSCDLTDRSQARYH